MKKRSLLSVVLSLFLALMLPVTSLAATQIDMSVMPGDVLLTEMPEQIRPAMTDLFKALSVKTLFGEGSGKVTLTLNGQDALDVAFRGDADGVFVQSAILGDKALYFSKKDLIDSMVEIMKESDSDFEENEFRQAMDQMFSSFGASMSTFNTFPLNAEPVDFTFDKEAGLAAITQIYGNDPGMLAYITSILDKIVVTEGEFASEQRDTADVCMTVTMDNEDFILLLDSEAMKPTISQFAAQEKLSEADAKIKMKAELDKLDFNLKLDMYFIKNGSQLVGMTMNMVAKEDASNPKSDLVIMDMNLNRLTTDVATYTFNVIGKENDEPEFGGDVTIVDNKNGSVDLNGAFYELNDDGTKDEDETLLGGNFTTANDITYGWISMVGSGDAVTFVISSQPTSDGTNISLELYGRDNAVAPVAPAASDRPLITFGFDISENVSEDGLAAVKSATVEDSIQLLKMNENEVMEFTNDLSVNAVRVLTNAMSMLPKSVLQLITPAVSD